jgi:hypothetical protein
MYNKGFYKLNPKHYNYEDWARTMHFIWDFALKTWKDSIGRVYSADELRKIANSEYVKI